ncbi:arginine--tRNA ligase [Halalkalibacillus sediminis]|uniref:Arginine--tRNA ligase n=1 Tax=Halalkalibacillus sediminis TaxID=2018042 RepID=A0A2I0QQX6_9BACI|nr:arginine--tRNA ligase [Halalkalibacillus sediminis]PKR76745.1 arginine--tRNA ligase [Halalkalibacillus sediminis]
MNLVETYADCIVQNLDGKLGKQEVIGLIEKPKYKEQGELAFPCFALAKILKKSPAQIANELAEEFNDPLFEEVVADGPYLNGFLNKDYVSEITLKNIIEEGEKYGSHTIGEGKKIVLDVSSPNIAKPFSMGHLRSTVIGNSLSTIAEKCGFQTVKINHIGDWGTQFGKLIAAYKYWGEEQKVRRNPIKELLDLYVRFHEEAEYKPKLEDEARKWFKNLEEGNEEALQLWKWFRDESLKEFEKIYQLLDVEFDSFHGEAFYNDKMVQTIDLISNRGLLKYSEGAEVVELSEYDLPPSLIRKSDGATLYATRDLTAAIYRYNKFQFDKAIYVVGQEQSIHFQQLFLVLEKMGYEWAKNMQHVSFGFILKEGKKMSTRKGKVVLLEEVIKEAIDLAEENIKTKNPQLENKREVAKMVGVGAIIFHDLKNHRKNNVEFSLDDMLRFEGSTGPYVQYTHARAKSILKKAEANEVMKSPQGISDEYGWQVVKQLMGFPDVVERSHFQNDPSHIAKYLLELCRDFNKYYGQIKILQEDDQLESRLALVKSVTIVLNGGLKLLGIKAPARM